MQKYLAIIPARGGSKRLPRKNLVSLCGEPLIAYTIRAAKAAKTEMYVVISTDSSEIALVAQNSGADRIILRPAELATDDASSVDVVRQVVQVLELEGTCFQNILLLQPTSPLRTAAQIDAAIARFVETNADTLTSVVPVHDHPYWLWRSEGETIVPLYSRKHVEMGRSELPPYFAENGAIYITRRTLLETPSFYGERVVPFEMDSATSTDIDDAYDLAWAEFLMTRNRIAEGSHV